MSFSAALSNDVPSTHAEKSDGVVLSVDQSVLGKRWVYTPHDSRLAQAISQSFGLPELVGRILAARGIELENVADFLNPTLRVQLPNPLRLKDMAKAAQRIAKAIQNGDQVAVFGDYDVDGATSSALLARYFQALGQSLRIYIPDRIVEGYGPNAPALLGLQKDGIKLIITVDCGVTAHAALDDAAAAGLEVIVLDHHRAESQLPPAVAIVNPNRLDDDSGQGHLAAVGVVFLTLISVNKTLRESGFFKDSRPEPNLLEWLDLVALGTVCDVVPLKGVNRAFVAQGLRVMSRLQNLGLKSLADVAGIRETLTAFHLGYLLGPRVNAGGRVGEAGLGAEILATQDASFAAAAAARLHEFNAARKTIEDTVLQQALEQAETYVAHPVLIVSGEGWHPGVIGIVAARLKEKYHRPVCVIAFDDHGVGKASGRSVTGLDLGAIILSGKGKGLLVGGGGHKMAAGFTITRNLLDAFREHANDHVLQQLGGQPLCPLLSIDGIVGVTSLTPGFVMQVEKLAPYGAGHAEPRFLVAAARIMQPTVIGSEGRHLQCYLQDSVSGHRVKAIAFRAMETELGEMLISKLGQRLHVAGHVALNTWQGKKNVQFQIVDAAFVQT